mgnify:FL=1
MFCRINSGSGARQVVRKTPRLPPKTGDDLTGFAYALVRNKVFSRGLASGLIQRDSGSRRTRVGEILHEQVLRGVHGKHGPEKIH